MADFSMRGAGGQGGSKIRNGREWQAGWLSEVNIFWLRLCGSEVVGAQWSGGGAPKCRCVGWV